MASKKRTSDDDKNKKDRLKQQATVPYKSPPAATTTTSSTVPVPKYIPPTRTPAAPSGTPRTTTTTTPPATLPPRSSSTTTPKSPTTTAPKGTTTTTVPQSTTTTTVPQSTTKTEPMGPFLGQKTESSSVKPKTETTSTSNKKSKKDKKEQPTEVAAPTLEDNVRKLYPEFAYLLDNPELFGDDVLSVLKRATKDGWTSTRFKGAIQATKYWQNTVSEAKNFDALTPADKDVKIQDTIDEISQVMDTTGFDSARLRQFASDLARKGIKGDQLKQLTYGMATAEGMSPEVQADVLSSDSAVKIKNIVKAYGGSISDDTLKQYLADGKTAQQIQTMYREKTKGLYPHLAMQLDADLTMDDITKDYKAIAANVLEKTESEIDFTKPEFLESISSDDGKGNKRQLSLGEWTKKLKTDDRYGYSKTTRAIQDAREIAFNISKAFGKVL